MKKAILLGLSIAMLGTVSFASAEVESLDQSAVLEQEDGAIANQDLETLLTQSTTAYRSDSGAIIGGVIGGIIGAIAADRWDRGHHRPGRFVTCFAQNRRGEMFRATARRARAAQDLAMRKCFAYSRACRPVGCR